MDATVVGRNLDLTSFPNSTGPRHEPGKRTPEEYELTKIAGSGTLVTFAKPDGSWQMSLEILGSRPGHVLACFRDQARNGGSYNVQQALDLTYDADRLYKAQVLADAPECPTRP